MPTSHVPHTRNPFRLQLLGGATLLGADGAPIGQQRRRLALLALVTAAGDTGVTRDRVMAALSPDSPVESARHALHQLLYYLRQQLGEDPFVGTDPLRLNPGVVTTDHREFDQACDRRDFSTAVALYGGPFLDGFHLGDSREFEDWAAGERARLGARFADALFQLARDADSNGDRHAAIEWWRRLAVRDPLDGRAALGLVTALAAVGDTPGAVRHARAHGALVRHELGREPDPGIAAFLGSLPREQRVAEGATSRADADPASRHEAKAASRPRTWVALALVLIGVFAVAGFRWFRSRQPANDTIGRLAVLPLVNGSSDTTVASMTEALTQGLISALSRAGLRVIGYYSVEKYRGSRPPVAEIGRDLRVDAVATWTVLREDDQWRVSLDVSRPQSGEGLWSSTRYIVDSLRLGDVAEGAARELTARFALRPVAQADSRAVPTTRGAPEAKIAYLLGMDRIHRGSEAIAYSQGQFERAIAIDSSFAPGYAGLAYTLTWSIDYGLMAVREACARARPSAERALALDPQLAFAHLVHARLLQHCDWKWNEADAEYRRAIALEPTAATYHHYGWFLSWYLGRFREGVLLADSALVLEPTAPKQRLALAWRLALAGDLDRAEQETRAAIALEPQVLDGHWILAEVSLMRGDFKAAEREALLLKAHPSAVPPNYSMLGEVYGRTGRNVEARAYIAELTGPAPMTAAGRVALARTQMALGERDAALTTLEGAVDDGVFIIPYMPYWGPIRDHPRFQALMRRMGLSEQ